MYSNRNDKRYKSTSFANCPTNITVECNAVPTAASPTATDNCDTQVTINYSEQKANGSCVDGYELIRTWTATDNCNNSSQCTQTVTVRDTKAPVFANCPTNITVECNAVPTAASPTATDNCDLQVTINYSEQKANGSCVDGYELIRTWTATDNCNNSSQCTQTVTVRDTKAPVFANCPTNVTVECNEVPTAASPSATDNCDTQVTINYSEQKQMAAV
ncbi:MAG: hypothetical protein IPL95_10405 [Saprospiraceae bacterium]|nr:hypothetical protein [Saprospiraceae bacterium]